MNNNLSPNKDTFLNKKIFSGLIWKFSERICAQLVSLIVSIILARLLSPDDYGAIAVVMIFITLANVLVSSGFGSALVQKKDADDLDFSSVFWINLLFGFVLYTFLFAVSPAIARFYKMPVLTNVLRLLGIRIVFASINTVQQAYVSRKMLFRLFFIATIIGTVISGIVGVFLAYAGFGIYALVVQYLLNAVIDTIVLGIVIDWRPSFVCSLARAVSLMSFGWKILISGLLDTGYTQIRGLIIGKIYTVGDLAFYNQGDKFPSIIVTNVNSSIQSVLFPALAMSQDNIAKIKEMTRKSIKVSSYILWPIMIGFIAISEPFVKLVLTDKWLPCVPYLRIFCISYGMWPIHTANLQAIKALGRSDIFLKLEIIKKTIGVISIFATVYFGPYVMAIGLVVTGIISMFINAFPNIKLLNYSITEQLKDMLPSLILAIVMGAIVYPISLLPLPLIVTIIIQVMLGGITYIAESALIKYGVFFYLIGLIKK